MTFCALHAAVLTQTLYKSNLEFSVTQISNKRMHIAYQLQQLSNVDMEDPRIQQLQYTDSYLEQQQKVLETQLNAAATQLKNTEEAVKKNVQDGMKLNLSF